MTLVSESRAATTLPAEPTSRFFLERKDGLEFPFVGANQRPIAVWRWIVMAVTASALMVAFFFLPITTVKQYVGESIVPFVLPLAVLAVLSGQGWTRWFRRVNMQDVTTMLWYMTFAKLGSSAASYIVQVLHPPTPHPLSVAVQHEAAQADWWHIIKTNLLMTLGLPGEELFALVPFVAIIAILYGRFGVSRTKAIVIALVVTVLAFGALHLPVYGFDYLQAFLVIGTVRVFLTLSFIRTKNLWVPIGAHMLFDWTALLNAVIVGAFLT